MKATGIQNYFSLIKFSHTLFALPFAIIGFFLGLDKGFDFSVRKFLLVIACMVFARSAAMAFNRYIDKDIDSVNPRTKMREIPSGIIKSSNALLFVIITGCLFVSATYFINEICFYLSPVALLVILGYSYTKRFTSWCHFVLGLGLSLAPVGAYVAVTSHFDVLPVLFSFIVLFWVSGFDVIYALQDEQFDKANQLHSLPVRLGKRNALMFARILHLFVALLLVVAGIIASYGIIYFSGAVVFITLLVYQHSIVKHDNLSRVNIAFFTSNGIASVVFCLFVLAELLF